MDRKIIAGILIVLVMAGVAYAQFAKPEQAVKYRKAVMFLIAQHFGRMGAMVKGSTPYEKETFARNAALMETFTTLPWGAFMAPGTDKGDTTMSAAVFKKPAKFEAAARSFEDDTAELARLARSGNFNAAKAQFGKVAKNCKGCHTDFRVK